MSKERGKREADQTRTQEKRVRRAASEQRMSGERRVERAERSLAYAERRERRERREKTLRERVASLHSGAHELMHEAREHHFPESGNIAVQLLLFLFGMLGYWGALGRERLRLMRRGFIHRTTHGAIHWHMSKYHPLFFSCAALALVMGAVFFTHYTVGTTLIYDGHELDTVASEKDARSAAESIASITAETLGESFTFSDRSIQYSNHLVARSAVVDREALEEELSEEVGLVTRGYSLYIDDELVGSTEYEGALEGLLDQLKESYISEDTLTVDFVESVRIAEGYVPTESIVNLGQIAELLNSTKSGEVTYTVVKGDTWSGIANSHGMTTKELLAINPDFDINRLQIGDELIISNAVPYLTVKVTERQNYVEDVQYDISYVDDDSMYQGDYRVISKGVYGTADVVVDVTYVNGEETERSVISSVTLTDPVTEQRAQGTKPRPTWYPTGSFRWPTTGRITSYFGYRNTGIKGATTNHKGIDISVSYGTPIYAADGGIVTYSGYKGAMGRVVIIDHQNGFVTYYEHNSSLLVSAGDKVYKGQQIAKAGSSGVSSGVHCHFGVQYNGSYVNPLNYLP